MCPIMSFKSISLVKRRNYVGRAALLANAGGNPRIIFIRWVSKWDHSAEFDWMKYQGHRNSKFKFLEGVFFGGRGSVGVTIEKVLTTFLGRFQVDVAWLTNPMIGKESSLIGNTFMWHGKKWPENWPQARA